MDSIGSFNNTQIIDPLVPKLSDPSWQVRQSVVMYLGPSVHSNPQLVSPFISILKEESELWTRQLAAFSLNGIQESQTESVKSLIRQNVANIKVAVLTPGIDDFNITTSGRELREDCTKNWTLRRILELGGIKVIEHHWSGRMWEMTQVQLDFEQTELKALILAGENGAVLNIGHSAGNIVTERLFEHIKPGVDTPITDAINQGRIKIISLNSPSIKNFGMLDPSWKNVWSEYDPISRISELSSPNKYDIMYNYFPDITKNRLEVHSSFKDPRVISDVVNKTFPNLHMPQLDNMLRYQDVSSWRYFPSHGSWPGTYDFSSIAPPDYWQQQQFNIPNQYLPNKYQSPILPRIDWNK